MNKKKIVMLILLISALLINAQIPNNNKAEATPPHYSGVEMYGKWNGNISVWIPVYRLITLYPGGGGKHVYSYNNQGLYLECGTYKNNSTFDTLYVTPKNILNYVVSDNPQTYILKHDLGLYNEIYCRKFVRSKDSSYLIELVPDIDKSLDRIDEITELMTQSGDTTGLAKAIEEIHKNPLTRSDTLWRIQVEKTIK